MMIKIEKAQTLSGFAHLAQWGQNNFTEMDVNPG
jgi:hypothetical protein